MTKLSDLDSENFTVWRDRPGQVDAHGQPDYGDVIIEPTQLHLAPPAVDLYAELRDD